MVNTLERLLVVENQPAWAPHMRSRSVLRTSPKRHFVDPSLAVAALRGSPQRFLAQPLDGEVLHYRDNKGLEVDAVVQLIGGGWGAFEVKLGTAQVDRAAAVLTKFAASVDTSVLGPPAVLAVITATGYGYRRPDGVCVVPIGGLGP